MFQPLVPTNRRPPPLQRSGPPLRTASCVVVGLSCSQHCECGNAAGSAMEEAWRAFHKQV